MNRKKHVVLFIVLFLSAFQVFSKNAYLEHTAYVYYVDDSRCLLTYQWNIPQYDAYRARFVALDGTPLGSDFYIFSKNTVAFNKQGDFFALRMFDYPETEGWPASYSLNGQIYHANLDSTPSFYITGGTWSECGMGCGGFGYELVPLSQDFLLMFYHGGMGVFRFDSEGNQESPFGGGYNPLKASMAATSDSSFMVSWFHARRVENDSLVSGVYVSVIDHFDSLQKDSVLIKSYAPLGEQEYCWGGGERVPDLKLSTLNDSTYQLFILDKDTCRVSSYLLNREGLAVDSERVDLPQPVFAQDDASIDDVYDMVVSNFMDSSRTLFFRGRFCYGGAYRYWHYLLYFDRQGHFLDLKVDSSARDINYADFKCKIGRRTFWNAREADSSVYLVKYEDFQITDSLQTGTLVNIERFQQNPVREFILYGNYPNPFNPSTTIYYQLKEAVRVKLDVYNTRGQKVRQLIDKRQRAGNHSVTFNANGLASGVYYYRLTIISAERVQTISGKMLFLK